MPSFLSTKQKKKMTEVKTLQKAFELYKRTEMAMPFKAWATLFFKKGKREQNRILTMYGLA